MTPIDYALAFLWLALTFRNSAALLPLFILSLDCYSYSVFISDFPRYCLTSAAYFLSAQVNIRIPSGLRYALLAGGAIYLTSAIDVALYEHADISTIYFDYMPYFVNALNAAMAVLLMSAGGRGIVGIISGIVNNCIFRLQLRKTRN
ncbi:hypothetical protein ORI99_00275 [Alishewanella sp. SMS9]|nr:hypothetical protein [Alishewanella sp. SMS9]